MLELSKVPEISVMVNGEVAPVVVNVPEPLWWPSPPYVQLYCVARACVAQVTNAAKTAATTHTVLGFVVQLKMRFGIGISYQTASGIRLARFCALFGLLLMLSRFGSA